MADKRKPPENVKKLIASQTPKPKRSDKASLPKRFQRRAKPKSPPANVLALIARALKGKK